MTAWSTAEERQEFFLPVSGFVWLYPEEVRVVNHPAFQRLGHIYQLGQTHLVFRGATHKRIEHALGTLQVVQRMIEAVNHNGRKGAGAAPIEAAEGRFIRLGALLHDIGHLAAGHTLEDELGLFGAHDGDARLELVFGKTGWTQSAPAVPSLGTLVDDEYAPYLPAGAGQPSASALVRAIICRDEPTIKAPGFRLGVARDMIANTICADLLDYLHRDWYHIGKPRPWDERLFQYMEVRDQFVLALGNRPKLRTDAVSNILDLLEWRYQLADVVLLHRAKLAAAAMLDRALFELWGEGLEGTAEWLLPFSDEQFVEQCRVRAVAAGNEVAARLLESLAQRRLFRAAATYFHDQLPEGAPARLARRWAAPAARAATARRLERELGLAAGSVTLYCPARIQEKIAGVRVAIGDEIAPLAEYEAAHADLLTGGHLDAQLRRFRRLWRVAFFLERGVDAPAELAAAIQATLKTQD